jgi:hypothetical protein
MRASAELSPSEIGGLNEVRVPEVNVWHELRMEEYAYRFEFPVSV